MPYDTLLYEKTGQIVKVTLNRPDVLNAISDEMVKEIRLAIDEADADPGARVVILTGAGRSFSAGYDIKPREDGRPAADPQGFEIGDYIKLWWDRDAYDTDQFTHFWKLGVPVIASVRGYCFGGGFWYSMACDITIAADNAVFGQPRGPAHLQYIIHVSRPFGTGSRHTAGPSPETTWAQRKPSVSA